MRSTTLGFAGFAFQDDPGRTSFADRDVVREGKVSCRMQDVGRGRPGSVHHFAAV